MVRCEFKGKGKLLKKTCFWSIRFGWNGVSLLVGGRGWKNVPKVCQGKQNFAKIWFCRKKFGYIVGVWVVKTRLWWGLWNIRWGKSESRRRCGSIGRVQKLIWSHGRSVFDVLADGFFYIFFRPTENVWNFGFLERIFHKTGRRSSKSGFDRWKWT